MNTNKTIEEKIKELLPKKLDADMCENPCDSCLKGDGYNKALDDVLLALPAIKNAIYEVVVKLIEDTDNDVFGSYEEFARQGFNRCKNRITSQLLEDIKK